MKMQIGPYEIESIVLENFRLDGGAMFGAVPKTLWSKRIEPDELNRIPMVTRVLLIKSKSRVILVDTGCGDKWSEKLRGIYQIENICSLSELNLGVTDVILTHLHFDHGAGLVASSGELTFPEATLHINASHYEHALSPGVREKASYLPENILPLKQASLNLTKDGDELFPGIKVYQSDGHTKGMQWLTIEDPEGLNEDVLAYPSDLMPTRAHMDIPYVMGYDLNAELCMKEKTQFLSKAKEGGWSILFEHDSAVELETFKNNSL